MKAAVVVFPGSNRDGDVARALRQAGARVATVWHAESKLPRGTDLVVLPGGFSYGDYLRCGAIAARAPVMDAVRAHAGKGGLGARHLQRLPDPVRIGPPARRADAQRQSALHLPLAASARSSAPTPPSPAATRAGQAIQVCVAHGEGNYFADPETTRRLEGEGRVAFRYCDARGEVTADANRNGSLNAIAGIYSERLNVLGLMPHPENLVDPLVGGTDGRGMFESLAAAPAPKPARKKAA